MSDPPASVGSAAVVGGGPAGLMTAEVMSGAGLQVTVYEHMNSPGRKFLLAGRGGLNITHSESLDRMLLRYGPAAGRLERAVREFGPDELRAWCASLGEPTFVGSSGRVFPASFRATPLLRSWLHRLAESGVEFALRHRWTGWGSGPDGLLDPRQVLVEPRGGDPRTAVHDVTVLALGGASWPRVGSDGRWVDTLVSAGVEVRTLRPSNFGVTVPWTAPYATRFAGTPLKNVAVSVGGGAGVRGDAMITAAGLEGGPVYAHSASIRRGVDRDGSCVITIDLHPDLDIDALAERIRGGRAKDSMSTALRRTIGLTPVEVGLLREATANRLPSDPASLARLVKAVPLVADGIMPLARAISTAGGIALDEVDDAFMLRRLPGVFVAGEMLDWEAPTGGYLLQASFSTAVAAGRGAVRWLTAGKLSES